MLILTMRPGEKIHLGDNVVMHYLRNNNGTDQVSIGFDAPRDFIILRDKIKIKDKNNNIIKELK